MLFVILLMFCSACGDPIRYGTNIGTIEFKGGKRIVNNPAKYPFMIHIEIKESQKVQGEKKETCTCGGVLIKPALVLTAAHCLVSTKSKPKITVMAGAVHLKEEPRAQYRDVREFEIHEDYLSDELQSVNHQTHPEDDIAMLWLTLPFKLSKYVKPATLPKPNSNILGEKGYVAGWGLTDSGSKSDILQRGKLKVVPNSVCSKYYKFYFTKKAICIIDEYYKITPCRGDGGGPFIFDGVVHGLISFGATKEVVFSNGKVDPDWCDPMSPVVVTNLENYLKWIQFRRDSGSPTDRGENESSESGSRNQNRRKVKPNKTKKCLKNDKSCVIM